MTGTEVPPWDVAMLGPTRVGKTSLLTALRVAANTAFAGTAVTMQPADAITADAFADNDNLMQGELASGHFSPNSLPGDLEEQVYAMVIGTGVDRHRLTLRFHDYPGGWLRHNSERVEAILSECPTVVLPIDATLVVESGSQHKPDVVALLELSELAGLVDRWGARRLANGDPTRLVLAPVKCESYFSDNGGRRDQADVLFREVRGLYHGIVEAYRSRSGPQAEVLYAPVDTIGPIELMDVEWSRNEARRWRMTPTYRVRRDSAGGLVQRQVRGAEPILAQIIRDVIRSQESALHEAESQIHDEQRRRSAWYHRFVDWATNRTEERASELAAIRSDLGRLTDESGKLSSKEYGRVRPWT